MAQTTFSGPVVSTNGFTTSTANITTINADVVNAVTTLVGTGPANIIVIPTSDPGVAGAIWNNAGTLAVSAG